MKRTEMVKYMTQIYHESYHGGNSEMSDEERMSYILDEMEKIGIEPPPIDILPELTSFGKFLEKCGFQIKRYSYEYDFINEWEKE